MPKLKPEEIARQLNNSLFGPTIVFWLNNWIFDDMLCRRGWMVGVTVIIRIISAKLSFFPGHKYVQRRISNLECVYSQICCIHVLVLHTQVQVSGMKVTTGTARSSAGDCSNFVNRAVRCDCDDKDNFNAI